MLKVKTKTPFRSAMKQNLGRVYNFTPFKKFLCILLCSMRHQITHNEACDKSHPTSLSKNRDLRLINMHPQTKRLI